MHKIIILAASIRTGRKSNRVALYFENYIKEKKLAEVEIADLAAYKFPIFEERLKYQTSPEPKTVEFAKKIKEADGVLIVTPEYNGGYPASLKNVIDLLGEEWRRKPVAISTVSDGSFGGMQVITSLQFSLWKLKALTVPAMFPVPTVDKSFHDDGTPFDTVAIEKRAGPFISEFLWVIEAKKKMN